MPTIELIFNDEFDQDQVVKLLSEAGSGFEPDDRVPLDSPVVDGFTIAGVVLNAFSLATAIWTLIAQLRQSTDGKTNPKVIGVRRVRSSEIRSLPTGEIRSIVTTLEEISGSDQ
jgi:hypothetical protein